MRILKSVVPAALGLVFASAASAEPTIIHAGHLIAEPGRPPAANQSIVVENGKIVAIKAGFVPGAHVIELRDAWVMPGLIDMHTHVSGELNPDVSAGEQISHFYLMPKAEVVFQTLPRVKLLLDEGFTTIRNLGDQASITYALRDAIRRGVVAGPRMFVAESQIAVNGGDMDASHWDVREDLERYVRDRASCTGVDGCTRAVREEVQRGADVVKFRQSGLASEDPKIGMVESPQEVKAIIDTAHKLDRKVAVHVVGTPEFIQTVVAAGADTIEHGPLDDESIKLMKAHGTAYTPTLLAAKIVDYRFKDASDGTGKAYRAGVPIIFGTDIGIFSATRSHEEFGLLAQAGLPPDQVLRAATVNAANALGQGDQLGSIAPGKIADIIAMKVDPLTHIDQVAEADKVVFVMKQGDVFKGPR